MPCSPTMLRRYLNPSFVETGTYLGEGVEAALAAGFGNILSIELSESLFADAKRKFVGDKRVNVIQGDSSTILEPLISTITTTITFWLDAHYSFGITVKGNKMSPLVEELRAISSHPIKDHIILVDDRRFLGTEFMEPTEDEIIREIMAINPSYLISYEDGAIEQDIIVARVV